MRHFTSFVLGFLTIIQIFSCQQNAKKESIENVLSEIQLYQIDSICKALIEKDNTVGFSVAIAHKGQTVFSNGYGLAKLASETPATENTIYPIASVSKFITAITTMKMVEEDQLSLQDKIIDFFPDFPQQEHMDEITIEYLLRHQSGLVDHENWLDSIYIIEKRVFTETEFFDFIDQPILFKPGSRYTYSNSGYAVLSYILEKVSGLSFHDLIVEKLGQPLNLPTLGMWPKKWNDKNATLGYELVDGKVDTSFHMMTQGMKGDGGLSASVEDLLKLITAVTEENFISESSLNKVLSPSSVGPITVDYGLGVKTGNFKGHKTWGHSGGYSGTGWAMLSHYPESGFSFAATNNTNYSPEEAWMLRHKIMPIVLALEPHKPDTSIKADLELYEGYYESFNRWGEEKPSGRLITFQDGYLIRDNPLTEKPGTHIFPIDEHTFSWAPYPYDEFKFHVVDGEVVACSDYADGFFVNVRMKKE